MSKIIKLFENIRRNLLFPLDNNSKKYWDFYYKRNKKKSRSILYRDIFPLLPKDKKFSILDIGCATGEGTRYIKDTFPLAEVHGTDISNVAIEKAMLENRYSVNIESPDDIDFFSMDITKEELKRNYDYIIFIETLEHLEKPYNIIDKCLKHTSNIIIRCPYNQRIILKRFRSHKSSYGELTFTNYKHKVIKIDKYTNGDKEDIGRKYILYHIFKDENRQKHKDMATEQCLWKRD